MEVLIKIEVVKTVKLEEGETIEQYLERGVDIYLHSAGEEGYEDKEDLGGNYSIDIIKPEEETLYTLTDDAINGIKINDKIRQEELFEYSIIDREDYIDQLFNWIAEARDNSKVLMKEDLFMLVDLNDEYIFSSNSTNKFISKDDSEFNDTCKELLKLNESLTTKEN